MNHCLFSFFKLTSMILFYVQKWNVSVYGIGTYRQIKFLEAIDYSRPYLYLLQRLKLSSVHIYTYLFNNFT